MKKQFITISLTLSVFLLACQSQKAPKQEFKLAEAPLDKLTWQNKVSEISQNTESINWLADFKDPLLNKLVEKALTQNFDLIASAERLKAFEARYRITKTNNKPDLSLSFDASRRRQKFNDKTEINSNYDLALVSTWELDLWGRLEDLNNQAKANYQATLADLETVRLSTAASIARTWFEILSLSEQVDLNKSSLKSFQKSQEIIEERYERGLITALDVHLGRANLADAERNLLITQKDHKEAIRQLKILLGEYPLDKIQKESKLPSLPKVSSVPLGLPSTLLERRPDLIAANKRLESTFYQNENVSKNRLPSISLTGRFGTNSDQISELFDADRLIGNLTGQLIQPLFASGRLKAEQKEQLALYRQEIADYSNSVLNAFLEVENTLAAESSLEKQEKVQSTATSESAAAEELALEQYSNGVEDIITLLTSQRNTLTSRIRLAELKKNRLQNRVNLYLALGGQFQVTSQEKK